MNSAHFRLNCSFSRTGATPGPHIRSYSIVFNPVSRELTDFTTLGKLLNAMKDMLKGHYDTWEEAKLLHRDISIRTIQIREGEKFLIFSDSELTLAHVAEGLALAQIKYIRFSIQIPQKLREQFVLTFETLALYCVFLMELKHGAQGLNLVTASRVIFCEPVWRADIESQAIKRAHCIGQTWPIHVKTLAIWNTAEEKMVEWRNSHKKQNDKAVKVFIEQVEIRDFIANPKFLSSDSSCSQVNLDLPLISLARACSPTSPPPPPLSASKKPGITI
ncbi:hypothetical protein L218DRAFT_967240, partial [Marasmius fiardii PR-910]